MRDFLNVKTKTSSVPPAAKPARAYAAVRLGTCQGQRGIRGPYFGFRESGLQGKRFWRATFTRSGAGGLGASAVEMPKTTPFGVVFGINQLSGGI
jgi:hypothetical protein